MADVGIAIFIVVMLVVVVLMVLSGLNEEKREKELRELVERSGWRLEPTLQEEYRGLPGLYDGLDDRYTGPPFRPSRRGRVCDLVTERHRDRVFLAFQYSYRVPSGDERQRCPRDRA